MIFDNLPPAVAHIQAGRLRALAVTSRVRQSTLPDVPTMQELGFADFESGSWFGLLAPVGVSPGIVTRLNTVVNQAMNNPAMRQRYEALGYVLNPGTPEDFASFMRRERSKWGKVVAEAGIRAD